MKKSKNNTPKLPPGATVITHPSGRQVVVANPATVKASMLPTIPAGSIPPKSSGSVAGKSKPLPGASEATQRVKYDVFKFAANGYPKIIPYFTDRNPHYKVAAKYLGPEDILHIAICALIAEYYPTFKVSHAKNEGKESHVGQAKKKLMGVQKGVSDLIIEKPGKMQKLYLEIKVAPNKPTVEQFAYLQFQGECGHTAAWIDNIVSAVAHINVFGANK